MMGYGGYDYGMMGYGWSWIMMIGVLAIVVLGVLILFRYLHHSSATSRNDASRSPLDILNERYARGEIADEEYKKKKAEIKA